MCMYVIDINNTFDNSSSPVEAERLYDSNYQYAGGCH